MIRTFPHYKQIDKLDCGPTCLKIVSKYYKKIIEPTDYVDRKIYSNEGISIFNLCQIAEKIGFRTDAVEININQLNSIEKPIILHWSNNHYVVLYKKKDNKYYISNPATGLEIHDKFNFSKNWCFNSQTGKAILLEPRGLFYDNEPKKTNYLTAISYLFEHLSVFKRNVFQLFVIMSIISLIYAILPFITRSVIDIGVNSNDLNFIKIILIANISLLLFKSIGEWIKSAISLHIASRMKISILTDYMIKLFTLPISFFEGMLLGDIIQRARDQERIQTFISNSAISVIMSTIIMIVYSVILFTFNINLFLIFIISTFLYILWVSLFYRIRMKMDIKYFKLMGENESSWIEIIKGVEDIKLNNYSFHKRKQWEFIQLKLYKVGLKLLNIERTQQLGADFINGIKDIGLTFYGAILVLEAKMTFGTLIAILFIIGQLSSPVLAIINFIKSAQSAFISFIRVNEVNQYEPEQNTLANNTVSSFSKESNIVFNKVSFGYPNSKGLILNNITFRIKENEVVAFVGRSGCGKTTIMKLLTKIYTEYSGNIFLGSHNLRDFNTDYLRCNTGVVFQESMLFKDSILNNIVLSDKDSYDHEFLEDIIKWTNIEGEIARLPNGINTILKEGGRGLSSGQKQRILLARALYKKPKYLILDEVTNSIDSFSEEKILQLIKNKRDGQTVIIISHKLSTIKMADTIYVIENGIIAEKGNHDYLMQRKSNYYHLFKNQNITQYEQE